MSLIPTEIGDMKFNLKKPCNTCPFRMDTGCEGAPDWLSDVMKGFIQESLEHSCHQTDPKADWYKGGKQKQFCRGFLGLQKNMDKVISQETIVALVKGELDWADVDGTGIYKDVKDMIATYLKDWAQRGLIKPDMMAFMKAKGVL